LSQSEIIHLAADLSFLHTDYLWRMPGSWIGYSYYGTSEFYEDIARIAARGVMDMLFFGDTGGTSEDFGGNHEAVVRYGAKWPRHDMTPMIPLMAKAASGVGFALTLSTTYHHPFHCARLFNALDHVTRGRIAWNAVTSAYKNEAANYGFDVMMDHDERYVRAREFLDVSCKLWNSVEPDALVLDRDRGIYADPKKVHRVDHRGRYFNVRGPLPALPSPQRRPVIIQAGLSGPGMNLAATYAELQFSTRRSSTVKRLTRHWQTSDANRATSASCGQSASRWRNPTLMRPRRSSAISNPSHRRPASWKCRPSTASTSRPLNLACGFRISPMRFARKKATSAALTNCSRPSILSSRYKNSRGVF
jgi:long-chain alkane monooxygenase